MNEGRKTSEIAINAEIQRESALRELGERIAKGEGLEVLAENGCVNFRDALSKVSFAEVIEAQTPQLQQLINQDDFSDEQPTQPEQARARSEAARQANLEAYQRVFGEGGLIAKRSSPFKPEQRLDYDVNPFGYYASVTGANKFQAKGNLIHDMVQRDRKTKEPLFNSIPPVNLYKFLPVVRLYIPISTPIAPEAYIYLLDKMTETKLERGYPGNHIEQDKQIINFNDLMLNLANIQDQRLNHREVYSNNTIILFTNALGAKYSMQEVAKILLTAQQEKPEIFRLPPRFEAQAKLRMLRDFMVPVGNFGYIEQQDGSTYQKRDLFHIYRQLVGDESQFWPTEDRNEDRRGLQYMLQKLGQITERLKGWTLENPGELSRVKRHKYLPTLVDTKMKGW